MTLGDKVVVMCGGRIQQCGAPMDVYRRPANRFVAGFIGAPTMNFIDGRIESTDGRSSFVSDAARIDVEGPEGSATLGIRPEHLTLDADGPIELNVDVCEPLGDAVDVAGTCGEIRLVARLRRIEPPRPGDRLRLGIEPDTMHLFDADGTSIGR